MRVAQKVVTMLSTLWCLALCIVAIESLDKACIPGAHDDPSSHNSRCQCDQSLEGHPDLCCYISDEHKACYLSGDSSFVTFSKARLVLNYPCGTRVSKSQAAGQCVVKVTASSKEMKYGGLYLAKTIISLQSSKVVISFIVEMLKDSLSVTQEKDDQRSEVDLTKGKQTIQHSGIKGPIEVSYQEWLALLTIAACQTTIHIRLASGLEPPDVSKPVPGMCILTESTAVVSKDERHVCSLDKDLSHVSIGEYLRFAIRPMKEYLDGSQVLVSTTSNLKLKCKYFSGLMKSYCETDRDQINAMKKCAFILFNPDIRRCFYEVWGKEAVAGHVMTPYVNCLYTYCLGTAHSCHHLQNDKGTTICAPSLQNCFTWPPYLRKEAKKNSYQSFKLHHKPNSPSKPRGFRLF